MRYRAAVPLPYVIRLHAAPVAPLNPKFNFMKILAHLLVAIFVISFPLCSFACQPIGKGPFNEFTEEEEVQHSDLVITGRVIEAREAMDLNPQGMQRPYTYRLKISVEQWVKGGGNKIVEVIDSFGTDCDGLNGVSHIVDSPFLSVPRWKIYIKRWHGQLYVGTARPG